jgi:hypothetical protein
MMNYTDFNIKLSRDFFLSYELLVFLMISLYYPSIKPQYESVFLP